MTARTRSRIRSASAFTVVALLAMALSFVAVRGVYESARAGDATSSGIATSPANAAPAPTPSFDDAVSAYRAGQWTALAMAAFGVLFVVLRSVARRRGSVWLGAFASYLAGVGALAVTAVAYAIKVGGVDLAVIGAAVTMLAATIYKLPDGGADPVPAPAAPPRDPQAGYVAPHLNLVISIGLALLLAVPFAASCSSPGLHGTGTAIRREIVDCGKAEVQDLAADLVPAVTAIVTGDTPSWRAQLDALLGAGTHAGACAIRAVGGELAARAAAVVTGAHAEGQERVGAEHAREYLAARGFVFEVR